MNIIKKLFYKYFWKDLYYETKWSLWGIFKYLNITRKMRPWDYIYIIDMLQFQLTILKKSIEDGNEVFDNRHNKVKDIQRTIDLINNIDELKEDEWNELWDTIKKGKHNESGINSWWD